MLSVCEFTVRTPNKKWGFCLLNFQDERFSSDWRPTQHYFFFSKLNLVNIVAERKNFKLLFSAGIIFGRWGFDFIFSSNEDDLSHSTRMAFPGSIKGRANAPHIFFEQDGPTLFLTQSSSRAPTFNTRRAHSTMGHCSFWRLVLCHLFIPPRPTGPRNFRLDA